MNNQQNEFLDEFKLRDCHVFLPDDDVDFIKSYDVDGNISKGMKNVIDVLRKQTKMRKMERYMLYFVFGVCIIILVSLILPLI